MSILFHSIIDVVLFYFTPFYSMLFYFILVSSFLVYSILFYSPFYSVLYYSDLFYSIPFYFIPFYSSLFQSLLFFSALFYSIPFSFILFHSLSFYSIPFCSILFCFIPFYATLPYSVCPFNTQLRLHLLLVVGQETRHLLWNPKVQHWPSSNKPAANPSSRVRWIPSPFPWVLHTHSIPSSLITIFNKRWRWSSSLSNIAETAQWCIQSTHNCEDNRTKNEDQNGMAM